MDRRAAASDLDVVVGVGTTSRSSRQRAFTPYLAPAEREELTEVLRLDAAVPPSFADELRTLARRYVDDGDSLKLRAICLLVADLCEQGWRISTDCGAITFEPPGIAREGEQSVEDVKARVRRALQAARAKQLQEPAVRSFLARMERRTLRAQGRYSVLDLIDDGKALARELERVNRLPEDGRLTALSRVIDPVIEVCEAGTRCPDTGLSLIDVWRYFRHTWAHEYRPIPGRQMLLLVRNAARPRRPVIGIAMLASPVMRLSARDVWIGWFREAAEARLQTGEFDPVAFGQAMRERLEDSIAAIRWDDLASASQIRQPTETVALRLEQQAAGAAFAREAQLRAHFDAHRGAGGDVPPYRGQVKSADADTDWRGASEDLLFVRKRAESLSRLLFAKHIFEGSGLARSPQKALVQLLASEKGQRAIDIALTEFRKAGLSSEVADVSVCGGVHPYNELLGGKLVALLLTSQEVRDAYSRRYGGQVSVIASQMAGRAISKPADLKILTTTSLYGVGSSQYNRLVLRAEHHDELSRDIQWSAIGKSLTGGFGTFHLSSDTAHALRGLALARHDARRINNRFGEGTSPRLRQIREGLEALGLQSDAVLHHATPRIFYGCELCPHARKSLLGLTSSAPEAAPAKSIAAAWRRRWLSARCRRPETIEALRHLGAASVRASLHADLDGQFVLPIDGPLGSE
jgi:hypothetical protein